jgi:predicted transcriptional regulator
VTAFSYTLLIESIMKTLSTTNSIRRKITPLSVRVGTDQKDQLEWIAEKKERSVHFLLNQAVSEYIENERKRLEFYEDGRKAIEHYKETGLHTTHEEMMAWAESLGTDTELPLPPCHK